MHFPFFLELQFMVFQIKRTHKVLRVIHENKLTPRHIFMTFQNSGSKEDPTKTEREKESFAKVMSS